MFGKRKNSDSILFSYANLALLLFIIGIFAALTLKTSQIAEIEGFNADGNGTPTLDLSGEWIGILTEDYDVEIRYDYRIELVQAGAGIEGITYQQATNYSETIYAEAQIVGIVRGDQVRFYEVEVQLLQNYSRERWCRIEVTVEHEVINGQDALIGTWESAANERAACMSVSGRVLLTRQPD